MIEDFELMLGVLHGELILIRAGIPHWNMETILDALDATSHTLQQVEAVAARYYNWDVVYP